MPNADSTLNAESTAAPAVATDSGARPAQLLTNGVKLVGEAVLPGASLLIDGKVPNGLIHTALGFGARAAFGPIGLFVVAADSYSKSLTDKHLWGHFETSGSAPQQTSAPAPAAPAGQVTPPENGS